MLNSCENSNPKFDLLGPSAKIRTGSSQVHGMGIFSKEAIRKGELIEEARLLPIKWRSYYVTEPTTLDYIWANNKCQCEICKKHGYRIYVALGYGSLYNHANIPNTVQKLDFVAETMTIIAKIDIPANEEIFVSYGENYWLYRNLMKKVSPLKYT
ncbi:SET domain-containing protein-lysine N-methyltransferase [Cytophagaceae bacterium 50C-KIRBA]|uniref:SET domain-containing protein-lysine N-methyltransferase n=1 Tax=Aquirufa beregesia TaxID=2516556 RepID=A0ABX0ETA7_9BACT|nr:SET domain-containing protein-lysine N-methyltransferase [Aquirufa beregesia]NGZ43549.1 SET domain-containing protein-lysine N-methyltransferase [Aquirufa beregesia]